MIFSGIACYYGDNYMKLYSFSLSIAYIACRHHPYIESLPTLW